MTFEDFNEREKIRYLPREPGSPGSDPVDGDLIYFVPWGKPRLPLQHRRVRILGPGHPLRNFDATLEQLGGLEAGNVTVEVAC